MWNYEEISAVAVATAACVINKSPTEAIECGTSMELWIRKIGWDFCLKAQVTSQTLKLKL